jgi:hypothetical protein
VTGMKDKNPSKNDDNNIMADMRYISKSCALITESLQKGCDVMQMPNGDIIVSELKTVTFNYTWDVKKGKLMRTQLGSKSRRLKSFNEESALVEASKKNLETV